ncbi:MAG TPA: transposase [Acidimicrobiales bacterium]|nr:transposase [Acidimicrobiales bacterium]
MTPRQMQVFDDVVARKMRRNNSKLDTEAIIVRAVDTTSMTGGAPRWSRSGCHHDARPGEVTPSKLAAAYAQRWEIESAFDDLKTHQRGVKMVLRSKPPHCDPKFGGLSVPWE